MLSFSSPPRSKRGPALASNLGRKAAAVACSTAQPSAAAADGLARGRQMAAAQSRLTGSAGHTSGAQPGGRGMRQPFVGPSDAQFKVPQPKRPSALNLTLGVAEGSGAPPAIRTRANNRFDGGRTVSGHAAPHNERPTPYARPNPQPRNNGPGLVRAASTGVRVSLISVDGVRPATAVDGGDGGPSRIDTVAIEEVLDVPPPRAAWLLRRASSQPGFADEIRDKSGGNDMHGSFVGLTRDKGARSRFFQRKETVESHGQVEEVEEDDDDDDGDGGSDEHEERRTTPPMPRNSHGHAARPSQPDRPPPVRVSGRSAQMPPGADSRDGDDEAERARYLDQIADVVLDGSRAEIVCEEVKRWSNVAYNDIEAWKAGGEEFAQEFNRLNQSILDYAEGAERNFNSICAGIERYEAELQRTGNKLDDYRQGLARWGTDIVSGSRGPATQ